VAKDTAFFKQIIGDEADIHFQYFLAVEADRFGTFRAVAACHFRRDGFVVSDDRVDDAATDVLLDGEGDG
jgi:hypothetical protein